MRKMSSEMCVSKGSALLSGAQKHLIEITFKLRKRKSDDSSQTPQRGHTPRKSTESKAQKRPHISACVCCCVSHQLLLSLSLSLSSHFSHAHARGTARTKTFGRATDKSKTSGTLGGGVPKEDYKIVFPERNKIIKKWSWGSETELYL